METSKFWIHLTGQFRSNTHIEPGYRKPENQRHIGPLLHIARRKPLFVQSLNLWSQIFLIFVSVVFFKALQPYYTELPIQTIVLLQAHQLTTKEMSAWTNEASNQVKTKEEPINFIKRTLKGEFKGHDIVPKKIFAENWKGSAEIFGEFEVFLFKNTTQMAGWEFVIMPDTVCFVKQSRKRYNRKGENTNFHQHSATHEPRLSGLKAKYQLSQKMKRILLPKQRISCHSPFAKMRVGRSPFAKCLVNVVPDCAPSAQIDVERLLLSNETVRLEVINWTISCSTTSSKSFPQYLRLAKAIHVMESNWNAHARGFTILW